MNRSISLAATIAAAAATALSASALRPREMPDSFPVPDRAVVATGDAANAGALVAVLYDTRGLHFTDPSAPRFLFLDREGKVALGIGGYLKGTIQYDFGGAIDDGASFDTYDIPVPNNPAQRNQFYANANHSTIFLDLVGRSARFGFYRLYMQTEFSGGSRTDYGLALRQAYLKVGYVTAGLANSTFVDAEAGTPGIDDQGPAGEVSQKNILANYAPRFSDHISGAIGIEMPSVSYTNSTSTEKINQRVPDIPAYVQYEWGGGTSHVRLSGLLRNLSYRDLATARNRFVTGWAVQLSGIAHLTKDFYVYYQGAYGHGYAAYVNDLKDNGFDLAYSETEGKMIAPAMSNYEFGARYDLTSNCFMTLAYSEARTYKQGYRGGDTYKSGRYLAVNAFYKPFPDLTVGAEYLYGRRKNYSGETGRANRIMALLQYTF